MTEADIPDRTTQSLIVASGNFGAALCGITYRKRIGIGTRSIEANITMRVDVSASGGNASKLEHDRTYYKQDNRVERMFVHLEINRAIAIRCDQLAYRCWE